MAFSLWRFHFPVFLFFSVLLFSASLAQAQQHTISSFAPAYAHTGETVTINGTNFSSITGVSFGGIAASSFTVVSPTRITAVIDAGATGNIVISKTGFSNATSGGPLTFSTIPTVTGIVTDFGGFWNTNTTANNPVLPNNNHNLLAFNYKGILQSTGVNDAALSSQGLSFTSARFRALPAKLNGVSASPSAPLYIAAGSNIDGNTGVAIFTHPAIKDLTVQNVLTDGLNGLNLGTGYTNLPSVATSSFTVRSIKVEGIDDEIPDIIITQVADPSNAAFDTYRFLDAANNVVGSPILVDLSKVAPLGTYSLDLFTVAPNTPFAQAKPIGVLANGTNTTRQIRFIAFRLSDFGITAANSTQVRTLEVIPSGVSDMAFAAYNATFVNVPPTVSTDPFSNTVICNTGGSAFMSISVTSAIGGALTYNWEESTNGGNTWNPVTNGGIYSGAATNALTVSAATAGYKYRATVTEAGGYSATSDEFTITLAANIPLAGTLNPTGFSNCLNANGGTTALTVAPTGGTGIYSYQWSSSTALAGTYTDIVGANLNSYSPPLAPVGTLYYKVRIVSGCLSNLSTAAAVTISGAEITSVTNGTTCSTGSVALSATASGGTINWYATAVSAGVLGTGNSYNTPSISATTTYFVGTTLASCASIRVPVLATVANTITLSSANFNVVFATDVCAGSASRVTVSSSVLPNASYTITYNVAGANTITSATATMPVNAGIGNFNTNTLANAGSNTITITNVQLSGGCNVIPASGNAIGFVVNSTSPNVSNFGVTISNGCSNINSVAAVSSNTLPTGNYLVRFNISGSNTLNNASAQMAFAAGAPGAGSFSLPLLPISGGSNIMTITSISLVTAPDCATAMAVASPGFESNIAGFVSAGSPLSLCATGSSINVTSGATASQFQALTWSSSGTGSFANNTTAQALSATTYTPSAADITAGQVQLTLSATANTGCANSASSVPLNVFANTVGGTVQASQLIDANTQPADLTLTGQTGLVQRWQRSILADFSTVTNISNTTATLTGAAIGNVAIRTYFRAIVKSGTCPEVAASTVRIDVQWALPATWAYHRMACQSSLNKLEWATYTEANTRQFLVQRSSQQGLWQTIGTIQAAGNSQLMVKYNFTDSTVNTGQNLYRLLLQDVNGDENISPIMTAACAVAQVRMVQLLPNPVGSQAIVSQLLPPGQLRVLNAMGAEVLPMQQFSASTLRIPMAQLPAGTYFLIVNGKGQQAVLPFIKE